MLMCFAFLVVAIMAGSGTASNKTCKLKKTKIAFDDKNVGFHLPCKYNAIRETTCGGYRINLTPAAVFLGTQFRLSTMWLGITETSSGKQWKGRITNKKALKYYMELADEPFTQKGGDLTTSDVLTFSRKTATINATAVNGDFEISFRPWDPDNYSFKEKSEWSFTCHNDTFTSSGYPRQLCWSGDAPKDRAKELQLHWKVTGVKTKANYKALAIFYDILNDTETIITQTDEKCIEAAVIFQNNCTDHDSRRDAILSCAQILDYSKYRKCAVKYSCTLMGVFVECLKWACSNYTDEDSCYNLGKTLDFCRDFKDNNLTHRVEAERCYSEFFPFYTED